MLTGKLAFSKTGNIGRKKLILLNIPFALYNNLSVLLRLISFTVVWEEISAMN